MSVFQLFLYNRIGQTGIGTSIGRKLLGAVAPITDRQWGKKLRTLLALFLPWGWDLEKEVLDGCLLPFGVPLCYFTGENMI